MEARTMAKRNMALRHVPLIGSICLLRLTNEVPTRSSSGWRHRITGEWGPLWVLVTCPLGTGTCERAVYPLSMHAFRPAWSMHVGKF
jgi:hypothetical protein